MSGSSKRLRQFGEFRLDLDRKVLWHLNEPVPLRSKAVELLCALIENRGEVLSKGELLDQVWPEAFVEESVLSQNIYLLRKTFADYGATDTGIQTIPRRGYRFTGEVRDVDHASKLLIEHEVVERSMTEIREESQDVGSRSFPSPIYRAIALSALIVLPVVILIGIGLWRSAEATENTSRTKISSIAVLPLSSFASDPENESLRLRITDALITKLGKLSSIKVSSTTSILRFAGTSHDPLEAGRALEVDAVLDGRVQVENDRLRVTLQLISVPDGVQLWSEQFDGKSDNLLALQDLISDRLRHDLAVEEAADRAGSTTSSRTAYEAYLKGRYFWNQRTPDAYEKAIRYFREAISEDPNFAAAYAGLADCYLIGNRIVDGDPASAMSLAEEAARRSLELDETLSEAHVSMGGVLATFRRDWNASNEHFRRAIELDPTSAMARAWYGLNLISLRRFDEAQEQLFEASRIDPTSRNIAVYTIVNYYFSRRFDEAIARGRSALELDPNLSTASMYLAYAYEQKGMYKEAVQTEIDRVRSKAPKQAAELAQAFERNGIRGFWRKQIELKTREYDEGAVRCRYEIATRHAILGELDRALDLIESNFRYGGTCWNGIQSDPAWDKLHGEPRFSAVMKGMGFAE